MNTPEPVIPSNEVTPSTKESPFKAKVRVILMADDLVVAESDDTTLWGLVLTHIVTNEETK